MAARDIEVLTKATNYDLLTLQEAKTMLGIDYTDTSVDAQLAMQISVFSDVVSVLCNRCFAREEVKETWRELGSWRLFLSHFPVISRDDVLSVETPRGTVIDPSGWELEQPSGKIRLLNGQAEPIVVSYWGGFVLPDQAPLALKQATALLIRDERIRIQQAHTAGMRSLSHKNARVQFFDPNAIAIAQARTAGRTGIPGSVEALLSHYIRYEV